MRLISHKSHFFLWGRRRSLPKSLMKKNALQEVYYSNLQVDEIHTKGARRCAPTTNLYFTEKENCCNYSLPGNFVWNFISLDAHQGCKREKMPAAKAFFVLEK